ncbi:MAG: hypothetical protein ABI209_03710 [Edaphobacter sp.]
MTEVYLLWHSHPTGSGEMNEKLIGVYQSESAAETTQKRFEKLPGFRDYREGFEIVPYEVGKDHWEEGYFTE